MKILLPQLGDPAWSVVPAMSAALRSQEGTGHIEVKDPAEADVILFTECHQLGDSARRRILSHPLARRYRSRFAVYDERDFSWCWLPGVYVSMPATSFVARWQVAGSYWAFEPVEHKLAEDVVAKSPDLLASFVGGPTHHCREPIFDLRHDRIHIERVQGFTFHDASSADFDQRRAHFAEILLRSKFVLCPRGHGTSSFRLFETMGAGRVPVIISDAWKPPGGPVWSDVALRVAERHIDRLPAILEGAESRWAAMAAAAEQAYRDWFAPGAALHTQLTTLGTLLERTGRPFPPHGVRNRQYAHVLARRAKQSLRRGGS